MHNASKEHINQQCHDPPPSVWIKKLDSKRHNEEGFVRSFWWCLIRTFSKLSLSLHITHFFFCQKWLKESKTVQDNVQLYSTVFDGGIKDGAQRHQRATSGLRCVSAVSASMTRWFLMPLESFRCFCCQSKGHFRSLFHVSWFSWHPEVWLAFEGDEKRARAPQSSHWSSEILHWYVCG